MDLAQVYETVIFDRDSGQAVRFTTVPARSLADREPEWLQEVANELGVEVVASTESIEAAEALPAMVETVLRHRPPKDSLVHRVETRLRGPSQFAGYLSYEARVPFEQSPLSGLSLNEILRESGGTVMLAYLTGEPLLIFVAPGAIAFFYEVGSRAGRGIGDPLEAALRKGLSKLLRVPDPEQRERE